MVTIILLNLKSNILIIDKKKYYNQYLCSVIWYTMCILGVVAMMHVYILE